MLQSGQSGFTLLEIAVALGILVAAIGQLFVLFPMGVKLQQRAEDQTHLAELGKYLMSDIRGGARVSTNYWGGFSGKGVGSVLPGFVDIRPQKQADMPSDPWNDEVFNGRDDDGDSNVDNDAGGRGIDEDGQLDPWPTDSAGRDKFGFDKNTGWVGSPSPLQIAQVLDEYRSTHSGTTVATIGDLETAIGEVPVMEEIMKYRWTALVLGDDSTDADPGLYDPEILGTKGRQVLKAQNGRLNFEIFKTKYALKTEYQNDPRRSTLKKLSVKVYWREGEELNRSEEFVTYVANY